MNLPLRSKTTVGHLLYPGRPSLNFSRLVADLDAALAGSGAEERRTTVQRDGLAVIEAGSSRIAVAMAEDLDTTGAAAITVGVGTAPEESGDERLARRQAVLARLIAERLAARTAPAETIWAECDEAVTPELVERRTEDLAARRRAQRDGAAERARARRERPRQFVDQEDIPRLVAKVDATLDARRTRWDGPGSDLPPVDLTGLDEPAAEQKAPSAPLRLAAHLMDATLMVLLLPVGAAMMVYSLSRGANLNTSARVMAVTGIAMGAVQAAGGLGGLEAVLARMV